MVLCKEHIYFLASKKKVEFLRQVASNREKENQNGVPQITLMTREKGDSNKSNFEKLVAAIKESKEVRLIEVQFLKLWFINLESFWSLGVEGWEVCSVCHAGTKFEVEHIVCLQPEKRWIFVKVYEWMP